MAPIKPQWPKKHPVVACTTVELSRLRAAYRGDARSRVSVAAVIEAAEEALRQPLVFPSRGGQHNQWYQCEKCQIALKTVDDTHHRCPKCGHIYTGEPYDDVLFSRGHGRNLHRLHAAAWAWAVTDDPKFADFARQVLLGYAKRYLQYPYHSAGRGQSNWDKIAGGHLFEQTLNEASSLATRIAPAYDLVHDAPVMTAADRELIRDGLLIPMLENIDRNKAGKSNWQTWHNAAMLWGGAVLRDAGWIEKAIAAPGNGFLEQVKVSVTDEGMWFENSWGYHFYTLSAMVAIAEGARRLGIDLWSDPRLMAMFTLPIRYSMPDGTLPRFGDDVDTKTSGAAGFLEFAYHAGGDKLMLPHLSTQPTWDSVMFGRDVSRTGKAPTLGSEVFRGAGHAILRSGGSNGLAAVMTFGPYGGFHGHFDKLSFVFFGSGTELGVDPGRAASQAYRLPIHNNWYKATLSHNTVLVDRRSQAGAEGKLALFAAEGQCSVALATCDKAYPKTNHRRLLVLLPEYLLVFDQLDSNAERDFSWLYHGRGEETVCETVTTAARLRRAFPGCEYIGNAREARTDDLVRIAFRDKQVTTDLVVDSAVGTHVLLGDGPGASVDDRVPMVMITRRGKQASFAAVLAPARGTGVPIASVLASEEHDGAVRITVSRGDTADTIMLGGQARVEVRRNGAIVLLKSI